jgi:tRNA-uridine aminocarboxypropyltransferase
MRTRRLVRCSDCALPVSLCLCRTLPRFDCTTRILVIMHYLEERKPTNTGRLLARILSGAEIALRGSAALDDWMAPAGTRRLLLFPGAGARVLRPEDAAAGPLALVVPDGTWRQARRICLREKTAREAELVTLPAGPPGRYGGLRRTPSEGSLCTFEAVARALGILEGPRLEEQMMRVLDEFVRRSLATRYGRA